jgi:hypothetical protein
MKRPETFTVTENNGPRPNGKPGECFYCKEPIGNEHDKDCVIRTRTIVIRMIADVTVTVPECWSESDIDFFYNESSSCASNVADYLAKQNCICETTHFEILREASEDDEIGWDL